MQMTENEGRSGLKSIVACMRYGSIGFLIIWPFFMLSVIMLSDNPNVGRAVSFLQAGAYYLALMFCPLACLALWFDRRKARERSSLKYRFMLWLVPTLDLALVTIALALLFQVSQK